MADDKAYDSILNLNPQSAEHSEWLVRVALKQVLLYTIEARGRKVPARKFVCVPVGVDPSAYVMATVRHDFKDATTVVKADAKFKTHAVYTMTKPIDAKVKSQWIGAPAKMMILLDQAKMTPVLAGTSEHNGPAKYIKPRMKLAEIMHIQEARTVDIAAIIVAISDPKSVQTGGQNVTVRDLTVRDDSLHNGSLAEATLSIWGDTGTQFAEAQADVGITIVGCKANYTKGSVRLDARADAALLRRKQPQHRRHPGQDQEHGLGSLRAADAWQRHRSVHPRRGRQGRRLTTTLRGLSPTRMPMSAR